MTIERWDRLQELFHAASGLPESEQEMFLRRECGDDLEMLEQLRGLLSEQTDPAEKIGAELADYNNESDLSLEGSEVGAYRLIRRVGSGGMGSVFLAERADGSFERQVALKVVKKGMDTERVVQRFRVERQILARLDHPNIARLIDGGVTDDGRPYFVMEFVDGQPITNYCDDKRLGVPGRLKLFQKVCSAVQYAHQSLVVHRDLKPSNILVTDEGDVRLLDFGIAKLLDESESEGLTGTGAQLLTPAYAAPEQLLARDVTTVTDVYALGVILYELLAGRRPFEPKKTPVEYQAEVLSGDPIRPSTALTQLPATANGADDQSAARNVAVARGSQIDRLRAILRGDLDTICLMALRLEPESRYSSAEQFAADVQRYLDGQPVVARNHTLGYRLNKYLQRHRLGVISTAAAIAVFLVTIGFYTSELAAERDNALDQRRKADEVVGFVLGLFEVADPALSRGSDVTARELVDAGAQRVRQELQSQPLVQAEMMRVMGNVYHELGLTDEGRELLEAALERHTDLYGELHRETASTQLSLGILHQTSGDFEQASAMINQALDTQRQLATQDDFELLEAIGAGAFLQETIGDYVSAEALHREALALAEQLSAGEDNAYFGQALARLAGLYRLQDRPDEAEPLLRRALAMQGRVYQGAHPESDETKRQLAELLADLGQEAEAEQLFLELIESRTRMMGPDHYELGSVWNSYGHLLAQRGDIDRAIEAYETMLNITRGAYGDVHPALAAGYNNIAILYRNRMDLPEALENYQQSLEMQDAAGLAPRHPNRSFPIAGKGSTYLLMGRYDEAISSFDEALALRREHFEEDHVLITEIKSDLAAVWLEQARYPDAEVLLLEVYDQFAQQRGMEDSRTRRAAGRLVMLYERIGEAAKADEFREVAFATEEDVMLR